MPHLRILRAPVCWCFLTSPNPKSPPPRYVMCVLWYDTTAHSHIRGTTTGVYCILQLLMGLPKHISSVGVGVRGVGGNFLNFITESTPIYGFHGLFTRGSLDRMADHIGLVDPINHLPGVCTVFYPYTTIILIDHHHRKLQKFRVHWENQCRSSCWCLLTVYVDGSSVIVSIRWCVGLLVEVQWRRKWSAPLTLMMFCNRNAATASAIGLDRQNCSK